MKKKIISISYMFNVKKLKLSLELIIYIARRLNGIMAGCFSLPSQNQSVSFEKCTLRTTIVLNLMSTQESKFI